MLYEAHQDFGTRNIHECTGIWKSILTKSACSRVRVRVSIGSRRDRSDRSVQTAERMRHYGAAGRQRSDIPDIRQMEDIIVTCSMASLRTL
jgi:hypothetical protein